ncbi:MAG: hypothetical protein ACE5HQ_08805 [Gemmatimonadota bacterium]
MTHTLHRYGPADDHADDYLVLAMPARGFDPALAVERQKEFLRRALRHGPVNLGDSAHGAWHHSRRDLRPDIHWRRDSTPDPREVIDAVDSPSPVTAVFDNLEAVRAFLAELREADLGLSINVSALAATAARCCESLGIPRHSVEYSLGFFGRTERLPGETALRLCTMCGHGMIAHGLAEKMIAWVKTGRRTPEEAGRVLARFCNCGAFNPSRAARILREAGRS